MMVHMQPVECAWMLAVVTKQNTDLVRLASTAHGIFSPYLPVTSCASYKCVCISCGQQNRQLWRDKMRPART